MNSQQDQFLEEVLGLFALEAQEWLGQSRAALLELEQNPASGQKTKLCDRMACGITNLGGSAATVELRDLEKLAFALIPLLQVMSGHSGPLPAEQVAALREGLDSIIQAVERLGENRTGEVYDVERILHRLEHAAQAASPVEEKINAALPADENHASGSSHPSVDIMGALEQLERTYTEHTSSRHMIGAVIRQVRGQPEPDGAAGTDRFRVMRILQELDVADERFLAELGSRLPAIEGMLSELTAGRLDDVRSDGRLEKALQDIHALQETARALQAKAIMPVFHGLRTFLTVAAGNEVPILPQRFEAVRSRLRDLLPMAHEWVGLGKDERTAIEQAIAG